MHSLLIYYVLLFYRYRAHRDLHSFPTRRSSDLFRVEEPYWPDEGSGSCPDGQLFKIKHIARTSASRLLRSEEHTSELQSPVHLVCRLLLEKKKKNSHTPTMRPHHQTQLRLPYSL